jgi:ABC-type sugar transport system ATPase subunit
MNLLPGQLQGSGSQATFKGEGFEVKLGTTAKPEVTEIGIRPQKFALDPDGPLTAVVDFVEALGAETFIHFYWGARKVEAQLPPGVRVQIGDRLKLNVSPESMHQFAADGRAL